MNLIRRFAEIDSLLICGLVVVAPLLLLAAGPPNTGGREAISRIQIIALRERVEILERRANVTPPRLLFFTASWCGPCQQAHADLPAWLAARGVEVTEIDVDDDRETARQWSITEIPTFMILHDGREPIRITGYDRDGTSREELRDALEQR